MIRHLSKFFSFSITLLFATLIKDYILLYVSEQMERDLLSVWFMMAVTIVVYYPLFLLIDQYAKKLIQFYLRSSGKAVKNRFIGLLIGFGIALLVCFVAGAYIWRGINVFDTIL